MTSAPDETAKTGKGRVLAIDYGRKRIGLAISDELGMTARPLETLARTSRRDDLRRLRELVRKHQVVRIVVGNPIRLDGTAGEMAEQATRFAARVQKELGLPVELMDERLSSWEAQETTVATKTKRDKHASGVDAVAAAVILRDFLDREQTRKPTRK
jgi:putative Holliday junction resolvase